MLPRGARVLEIGCGAGDLLAGLEPSFGVGVDFSHSMVSAAARRHPHLKFVCADAHALPIQGTFDLIVVSDLVNELWDVQQAFAQIRDVCAPSTRIVINFYSRVWELPLAAADRLGLATPRLQQNWLTPEDIANLLHLEKLEIVRQSREILWPAPVPLAAPLFNRFLARLWPLSLLALTNLVTARLEPRETGELPSVSVIVPARNEAGNIPHVMRRVPSMGRETEIVFVEGHSSDRTYEAIQQTIAANPGRRAVALQQRGRGKGDAVRLGFGHANGDILMILDADLTVAPEDLPRFYEAIRSGRGEFVNGVRLVYPMEGDAMRIANFFGNKFFSLAFTWLLGQPVKDTLCGTKVLRRRDYERIAANRSHFGDFDPFGDFDLLFGAARLGLRIVDLPVRYHARTYGHTNIRRWRHGWLLLRMVAFAAARIKFV